MPNQLPGAFRTRTGSAGHSSTVDRRERRGGAEVGAHPSAARNGDVGMRKTCRQVYEKRLASLLFPASRIGPAVVPARLQKDDFPVLCFPKRTQFDQLSN